MKHTFLLGAGIFLLNAWLMGNAVAGDIKQVQLTLRILVDAPPPCSVKGSNVEFGDVHIKDINGTNYRTADALYTLNCGNKTSGVDDLRMQLKGTTTVINGETVMATEIPGLGIRIENGADNSLFTVGENNWTDFNINRQPVLKAVPVKQSGVQLTPAEFNASMTMVVDYQ
ncbi:fimbrial protein [Escherichia sp. E4742]|uniref:fimbrial protein n=1 Tax=Escherichia sp. E4742 TaxID=2044467 RepID=UPI001080114E|nr:fimbrial protein [Escherichia sp. E4742]QCT86067.1 fimbrial protein [Escherichia sp. E4742]TGB61584.1 fimbrial protein [Escherichia sp. E4742]TLJ05298.1 fimbrial protein [Escherichia sp. E4742]